ncbi:hypothetical protein ACTA71_009311 [Dictyostelium dimigraforme]
MSTKEKVLINKVMDITTLDVEKKMNEPSFLSTQNPFFQEIHKIYAAKGSGKSSFKFVIDGESVSAVRSQKGGFCPQWIECFKDNNPNLNFLPKNPSKFIQIRVFNPKTGHDFTYNEKLKLKINGVDLYSSNRRFVDIKSKDQFQSPVDVTDIVLQNYNNNYEISVKFPFFQTGLIIVQLVQFISLDRLVSGKERLFSYSFKLIENNQLLNSNDISINCPISKKIISLPAKFKKCQHIQCFDYRSFLLRALVIRNWNCPICNKPNNFSDLRINRNFFDYLLKKQKELEEARNSEN